MAITGGIGSGKSFVCQSFARSMAFRFMIAMRLPKRLMRSRCPVAGRLNELWWAMRSMWMACFKTSLGEVSFG